MIIFSGSRMMYTHVQKWRQLSIVLLSAMLLSSCHPDSSGRAGTSLSSAQSQAVTTALTKIRSSGLKNYADLGDNLNSHGQWMLAASNDPYIAGSEKNGDTPFAYTLPDDKNPKQPIAIVLAPRFFTDADPTAQAALMVHEMGHWMAFQRQGSSTEYDGYKAEFDAHKQLGLTESDGLVYTFMLDGVVENVVPIDKSYAKKPEVAAYIKESTTGEM
jgi:hypothetical protein